MKNLIKQLKSDDGKKQMDSFRIVIFTLNRDA